MTTATQTNTVDSGVKLPAAVRAASERATQLSEKLRAQSNSQNNNVMAITDVRSGETPVAPINPTPTSEPEPKTPSPAATSTYTEDQFKAMQGRFERAQKDNRQLIERLNETQRLLAFMQQPQSQPNPDTRFNIPITPAVQKLITDKERQEYGEELIDVVKRAAREIYDPIINELRTENSQLKQGFGSIQQNVATDARSRLYQELHKEVPDWNEINESDGFREWAQQIDPLSGSQRLNLIQNAFQTGQTSRVIAAFKGYKAEQAALSPAPGTERRQGNVLESSGSNQGNANLGNSQSNPSVTPAVDLNALAAPGRARSGQVPTSPDKPIVERHEITQFYADVTRGKYRGREQEQQAIERQIADALRENRVR